MKIKRELLQILRDHLSAKEISLLIGARQVGKTTLIKQIAKELRDSGEKVLFFNLDIETDFSHFQSQERLLSRIRLEVGESKAYIFIDEIQRKTNAGLFLKGLYDQDLPYKWIVTGSGSLELKESIHESLLGRKRMFELFPVTISEFFHYKTNGLFDEKIFDWFELEKEKAKLLWLEYLNFGGYPRVITANTFEEKLLFLQEIFRTYLERDISILLGVEKSQAYTLMIRLMADRIGQITNYSDLAKRTALSIPTLKKYLWYAEKTFILKPIIPFFRNPGKELVKASQIYFNDLGIRNFSLQQAGRLSEPSQLGFVFQNFVFQILHHQYQTLNQPLKYWRTKSQAEVDFILERNLEPLPIEVKCRHLKKPTLSKSFRSFLEKYRPSEAWIINLSLEEEFQLNSTTVKILPWYKIAFQ
jgi:predicted AAA+ superfamily ATPase